MKLRDPGRKIDQQSKTGKSVSADQNFVRGSERRQASNVKVNIHPRQEESNGKEVGGYWLPPSFMDSAETDWFEIESLGNVGSDTAASSSGIDLSQSFERRTGGSRRSDANRSRRAVFDQTLSRLLEADFGPNGFFIICHRDAFDA